MTLSSLSSSSSKEASPRLSDPIKSNSGGSGFNLQSVNVVTTPAHLRADTIVASSGSRSSSLASSQLQKRISANSTAPVTTEFIDHANDDIISPLRVDVYDTSPPEVLPLQSFSLDVSPLDSSPVLQDTTTLLDHDAPLPSPGSATASPTLYARIPSVSPSESTLGGISNAAAVTATAAEVGSVRSSASSMHEPAELSSHELASPLESEIASPRISTQASTPESALIVSSPAASSPPSSSVAASSPPASSRTSLPGSALPPSSPGSALVSPRSQLGSIKYSNSVSLQDDGGSSSLKRHISISTIHEMNPDEVQMEVAALRSPHVAVDACDSTASRQTSVQVVMPDRMVSMQSRHVSENSSKRRVSVSPGVPVFERNAVVVPLYRGEQAGTPMIEGDYAIQTQLGDDVEVVIDKLTRIKGAGNKVFTHPSDTTKSDDRVTSPEATPAADDAPALDATKEGSTASADATAAVAESPTTDEPPAIAISVEPLTADVDSKAGSKSTTSQRSDRRKSHHRHHHHRHHHHKKRHHKHEKRHRRRSYSYSSEPSSFDSSSSHSYTSSETSRRRSRDSAAGSNKGAPVPDVKTVSSTEISAANIQEHHEEIASPESASPPAAVVDDGQKNAEAAALEGMAGSPEGPTVVSPFWDVSGASPGVGSFSPTEVHDLLSSSAHSKTSFAGNPALLTPTATDRPTKYYSKTEESRERDVAIMASPIRGSKLYSSSSVNNDTSSQLTSIATPKIVRPSSPGKEDPEGSVGEVSRKSSSVISDINLAMPTAGSGSLEKPRFMQSYALDKHMCTFGDYSVMCEPMGVCVRVTLARKVEAPFELVCVCAVRETKQVGERTANGKIMAWNYSPLDWTQKEKDWEIHQEESSWESVNEPGKRPIFYIRSVWQGVWQDLIPLHFLLASICVIFDIPSLPEGLILSPFILNVLDNPQFREGNLISLCEAFKASCGFFDEKSSEFVPGDDFEFLGVSTSWLARFFMQVCLLPGKATTTSASRQNHGSHALLSDAFRNYHYSPMNEGDKDAWIHHSKNTANIGVSGIRTMYFDPLEFSTMGSQQRSLIAFNVLSGRVRYFDLDGCMSVRELLSSIGDFLLFWRNPDTKFVQPSSLYLNFIFGVKSSLKVLESGRLLAHLESSELEKRLTEWTKFDEVDPWETDSVVEMATTGNGVMSVMCHKIKSSHTQHQNVVISKSESAGGRMESVQDNTSSSSADYFWTIAVSRDNWRHEKTDEDDFCDGLLMYPETVAWSCSLYCDSVNDETTLSLESMFGFLMAYRSTLWLMQDLLESRTGTTKTSRSGRPGFSTVTSDPKAITLRKQMVATSLENGDLKTYLSKKSIFKKSSTETSTTDRLVILPTLQSSQKGHVSFVSSPPHRRHASDSHRRTGGGGTSSVVADPAIACLAPHNVQLVTAMPPILPVIMPPAARHDVYLSTTQLLQVPSRPVVMSRTGIHTIPPPASMATVKRSSSAHRVSRDKKYPYMLKAPGGSSNGGNRLLPANIDTSNTTVWRDLMYQTEPEELPLSREEVLQKYMMRTPKDADFSPDIMMTRTATAARPETSSSPPAMSPGSSSTVVMDGVLLYPEMTPFEKERARTSAYKEYNKGNAIIGVNMFPGLRANAAKGFEKQQHIFA